MFMFISVVAEVWEMLEASMYGHYVGSFIGFTVLGVGLITTKGRSKKGGVISLIAGISYFVLSTAFLLFFIAIVSESRSMGIYKASMVLTMIGTLAGFGLLATLFFIETVTLNRR